MPLKNKELIALLEQQDPEYLVIVEGAGDAIDVVVEDYGDGDGPVIVIIGE